MYSDTARIFTPSRDASHERLTISSPGYRLTALARDYASAVLCARAPPLFGGLSGVRVHRNIVM